MKKFRKHLTFWVLISIAAGILLGHFAPATAVAMEPLGKYFISLVKLFINPIIVVTIITGICGMDSMKRVGRVGGKALLYFEVVTTLALVIGVVTALVIRPGEGIDASIAASSDISAYRKQTAGIDWMAFFRQNATIQVLLLSILTGIWLSNSRYRPIVLARIEQAGTYIFKALHYVMKLSPIGAFGGMSFTIGKFGLAALVPLAKLMLCVYITMFLFIVLILGGLLKIQGVSIWKLLNYIRNELLIVLGTSSSEAALPSLMSKLERAGCHPSVVGLVVPTGYSFNLDGTSIYLSMAVVFLSQVYGIHLGTDQILTILGVLMVTSKGAAGVTGSGFIILASTLSAVRVIPLEGMALLLGVDRFMSEARAITNFIGNAVATVLISRHEGMIDQEALEHSLGVSPKG